MKIIVLGSAAGGGFPQWNCRCPCCRLAWAGDPRVRRRTQSGLAVGADGGPWILLNASPDLRQQILATAALHPGGNGRGSPIAAVVLTNAELDHVAGLLTLRERQPFCLFATARTHAALNDNILFEALDRAIVERVEIVAGRPFELFGLKIAPFAVPGKPPLYREGIEGIAGQEEEEILGLEIVERDRRCVFVPNCAKITSDLKERIEGCDLLFFDGTSFSDDEMVALGVSTKTAARMGHVAMQGDGGSLAALASVRAGRRIYLHLNNTNPVLVDGSAERSVLEAAGWELAQKKKGGKKKIERKLRKEKEGKKEKRKGEGNKGKRKEGKK